MSFATIKYSGAGTLLWTNFSDLSGSAMAVDPNGNIIATGNSSNDYVTIKFSTDGAGLWTNRYDGLTNVLGSTYDFAQAVAVDGSGNVFVTGYSDPYGFGFGETSVTIKYSNAGAPIWTNIDNSSRSHAYGVAVDASGNVFVSGYSKGTNGNYDYLMLGYSTGGQPLSTNRYNGP